MFLFKILWFHSPSSELSDWCMTWGLYGFTLFQLSVLYFAIFPCSWYSSMVCIGCGICVKKCPFEVLQIINLPKDLDKDTTHRYGPKAFKLLGLPVPKSGQVLGLVGTNGIRKSTAPVFRSGLEIELVFLHGGFWKYNTTPYNIFPLSEDIMDAKNEEELTI